jgi:catalase
MTPVTDLIGINLSVFPVSTAADVIGLLTAARDDPATGRKNPDVLRAFVEAHPTVARVQQLVAAQPAPVSLVRTSYRALHAYRFVNADGDGQDAADMAALPHDFLFDELDDRLTRMLAAFGLELQLAADGDPLDDVSAFWPESCRRVTVGRLELVRPISLDEIGDPVMTHDPTRTASPTASRPTPTTRS